MTRHIVHLTTVHQPFDVRIFQKECRTLIQAGYRVSLIATHTRHEIADGVEIVPLPRFSRRFVRVAFAPWAAYRIARSLKADLYHFHDPELLLIGVLLKLTTHASVIYDAHENYTKQMSGRAWLPWPLTKIVPKMVGLVEQFAVAILDAVVCATEHIAAQFPVAKAVIIKNYPLLTMVDDESGQSQSAANNYTLIYTGGWTLHRGIYQIIQALDYVKTPDVRLTLLGKCMSPDLQKKAESLPGFSKVDYLGVVPFDQVYKHMRRATVGLICNQPEHDYEMAQPNKLFEYMSAGLPVIASNFPLWQEVVEGHDCGLTVDPTQPEKIAQVIDHLLAYPEEQRRQMGQNGRKAVRKTYSWEAEGQKSIALYKELLT